MVHSLFKEGSITWAKSINNTFYYIAKASCGDLMQCMRTSWPKLNGFRAELKALSFHRQFVLCFFWWSEISQGLHALSQVPQSYVPKEWLFVKMHLQLCLTLVGKSQPRPTTRLLTTTSLRAWSATVSPSSPSPEAKWSMRRGSSRCHQETANSSTENPSQNLFINEYSKGNRSVKPKFSLAK